MILGCLVHSNKKAFSFSMAMQSFLLLVHAPFFAFNPEGRSGESRFPIGEPLLEDPLPYVQWVSVAYPLVHVDELLFIGDGECTGECFFGLFFVHGLVHHVLFDPLDQDGPNGAVFGEVVHSLKVC